MERRHDEHVGRPGKPREGIEALHDLAVQRHVSRHLAIEFEIHMALVEDVDGFAHALRTFARGMAEGGVGEHGDTWLVTHAAGETGCFLGDLGQLFGRRHVVNGGVGHEDSAATGKHDRYADHPMPRLGVDAAAHVAERGRVVAGHARHHAVGVSQCHHAGGKVVAVIVDQARHVAVQIALALQPGVEKVDIGVDPLGNTGIDDFEAGAVEIDAGALRSRVDQILAAEQDGGAEPLVGIG